MLTCQIKWDLIIVGETKIGQIVLHMAFTFCKSHVYGDIKGPEATN